MSPARAILRGSSSNLVRIACTGVAAIALPPLLTRTLNSDEYSAWVTLLQLSTYVALLDLGLQTVVARFVAEHHARSEQDQAVGVVRSASRILLVAAALGCAAAAVGAAAVPALLPGMPDALVGPARLALLLVGVSSALMLPFGPCLSAFLGLQRYGVPTLLAVAGRLLSAAAVAVSALLGGGLVAMAAALAAVNLLTAIAQGIAWRRMLVRVLGGSTARADRSTSRRLLTTGGLISLWSLGGVLVTGIDTVVVGHFDFASAGAFAVAATAVGFLITLLAGLFSPLMPAAASQQGPRAAEAIRTLTLRATRYSTLVIVLSGGAIVVFAYPLLALWVGPAYAAVAAPLLRLLVIGNCIRQLGYAYSLVVVARGQQRPATIATMSEAVVNLVASIVLAQLIGAAGVAVGTIAGAVVSIGLHVAVTMRYARREIPVTRRELCGRAVVLPLLSGLPLVLLIPSFTPDGLMPAAPAALAAGWLGVLVLVALLALEGPRRRRTIAALRELRRPTRKSTHAY